MAESKESQLHLWCIRHGERIEDIDHDFEEKCPLHRVFDLPLSAFGIEQAQNLAKLLKVRLDSMTPACKPRHVYVSPMARNIETAAEICKYLQLNMIIVPSLALEAHIVRENGLKFVDEIEFNLALKRKYIENVESTFLTKTEILNTFKCKEFDIYFMDVIHDTFDECIRYIIQQNMNTTNCGTVICVTHREKYLQFKIDESKFKVKRNVFGMVQFKREKQKPAHCEMFQYVYRKDTLWYNGKLEDTQ